MTAALEAEREGFDAFVIGCCYDPALSQCRELVEHPRHRTARGLGPALAAVRPQLRRRHRPPEGGAGAARPRPALRPGGQLPGRGRHRLVRHGHGARPADRGQGHLRQGAGGDAHDRRRDRRHRLHDRLGLLRAGRPRGRRRARRAVGREPERDGGEAGRDVRRPARHGAVPDQPGRLLPAAPRPRPGGGGRDRRACSPGARRWAREERTDDQRSSSSGAVWSARPRRTSPPAKAWTSRCSSRSTTGYGASGRNPGFVWLHCRNPGWALEVSLAGRRLYDELLRDLPEPFEFRAEGGLIYFKTPEQGVVFEEFVKARQADGLDMELIDGAEVRRLVGPIRPDVLGASFCANDAQINTPTVVAALAAGARAEGADVREHVRGHRPGDERRRPSRRCRDGPGRLTADMVVVATGAWTSKLLAGSGIDVPVGIERLQVLATVPRPLDIRPVVYGPLAAKQYTLFRDLPSWDQDAFMAPYEIETGQLDAAARLAAGQRRDAPRLPDGLPGRGDPRGHAGRAARHGARHHGRLPRAARRGDRPHVGRRAALHVRPGADRRRGAPGSCSSPPATSSATPPAR